MLKKKDIDDKQTNRLDEYNSPISPMVTVYEFFFFYQHIAQRTKVLKKY